MRTLSIDLSKIPTEKISKILMKDGTHHLFVDIVVADRTEPDKYGNDVTAWVSQTKEERDAKQPKQYIANGKVNWTDGTIKVAEKDEPKVEVSKTDDLPF